ncbi:MAG TPA: hypothetical protein VHR72_10215 [Gemmataceae bacterium]|jgi:hypothetical protein|nr:hypothetical protein [Gemmataceae bacterium]
MRAISNTFGQPAEAIREAALPVSGPGLRQSEVLRIAAADVLPPVELDPPSPELFDELEIPVPFRACVQKELTAGEKMLWVGRPSRDRRVHPPCAIPPFIGFGIIVLAGLLLLGVVGTAAAAHRMTFGHGFGCVFALVLALIGSAIAFLPKLNKPESWCRYAYVVTNRRALLIEQTAFGVKAQSYLPQQLLGMERRDHAEVAGAGDLVFEYVMTMGNNLGGPAGALMQQGVRSPSMNPQRVPRGFVWIDQVRAVEDLIRTALLLQLEQALDGGAMCATPCMCGATLEAPISVAGKSVRCPGCARTLALPAPEEDGAFVGVCRDDGDVPVELREKLLAGLDAREKAVWIGQPSPQLVLLRNGTWLAVSGLGIAIGLLWLFTTLLPAAPARGRAVARPAKNPLLPLGVLLASACVSAVPAARWWAARRTCYAITNRRAVVYADGLFGKSRDSYSPIEVSGMERRNSWLAPNSGDLVFRTVHVITRSSRPSVWNNNVRTVRYGLLAISELSDVEKIVRETLIDPFVDRLNQARA